MHSQQALMTLLVIHNHHTRMMFDLNGKQVVARTEIAILAWRQACLDAHEFKSLNDDSPLVRTRSMRSDLDDSRRCSSMGESRWQEKAPSAGSGGRGMSD